MRLRALSVPVFSAILIIYLVAALTAVALISIGQQVSTHFILLLGNCSFMCGWNRESPSQSACTYLFLRTWRALNHPDSWQYVFATAALTRLPLRLIIFVSSEMGRCSTTLLKPEHMEKIMSGIKKNKIDQLRTFSRFPYNIINSQILATALQPKR